MTNNTNFILHQINVLLTGLFLVICWYTFFSPTVNFDWFAFIVFLINGSVALQDTCYKIQHGAFKWEVENKKEITE